MKPIGSIISCTRAPIDPRHPLDRSLPARSRRRHGLVQRRESHSVVRGRAGSRARPRTSARPIRFALREEVGRMPEQRRGRPVVAPLRRSTTARRIVRGGAEPQFPPGLVQRPECRRGADAPAPGGRRGSPRTPRREPPRRPRASRRIARAARRGAPWARPRRRRRGSAGGGTGTHPRPRASSGPAGSGHAGRGSSGSAAPPDRRLPATPPRHPRGTACRTPPRAGSPPVLRP